MSELRFKLNTFGVDYQCDACGKGFMVVSGDMVLTSMPPQYQHTCTHCGKTEYLTEKYPTVKHERLQPPYAETEEERLRKLCVDLYNEAKTQLSLKDHYQNTEKLDSLFASL